MNLGRLMLRSLASRPLKRILAILAVAVGAGASAALVGILVGIADALSEDLRTFGANVVVTPAGESVDVEVSGGPPFASAPREATFEEAQLSELKTFFWRQNVLAIAPLAFARVLVNGREVKVVGSWFGRTEPLWGRALGGLEHVHPAWSVQGRWPQSRDEAAAGRNASFDLGETLRLAPDRSVTIVGIVSGSPPEDRSLFVPLPVAQELAGTPGRIHRALVSIRTQAELEILRTHHRNPRELSRADYERWYCSNYPSSVACRMEEAMRGVRVEPVRRLSDAEASVLGRVEGVVGLLAVVCAASAALGILAVMSADIVERRREFAVLKAVGATGWNVAALVSLETLAIGFLGGGLGSLVALALGGPLAVLVSGSTRPPDGAILAVAWCGSVLISIAGGLLPLHKAVSIDPGVLLRAP